jgi:soluble lytic murein transglycosylase-like protein
MGLDYSSTVIQTANANGVDPNLALAVMNAESGGDAGAISSAGAVGLFQLMPSSFPGVNINDPVTNIETGIGYLAKLLNQYNGDQTLALAAYNAGPGNVAKYGGVPPFQETQNYIAKILGSLGVSTSTDTVVGLDIVDPTTGSVSNGLIWAIGIVGLGALLYFVKR